MLPLFVLSDNLRSFFSWGIKAHEKGFYNHFMIMHRPGYFASQNIIFREVPVENYLDYHRLKFWTNIYWTPLEKKFLIRKIQKDLKKSWWKRLYDPIAIIGQFFNQEWIQIPGLDICSDKSKYIKYVDQEFNLKHPSPTDINKWFNDPKQYQRGYFVFGRYVPD